MSGDLVSGDSFIESWLVEHIRRFGVRVPVKRLSLRQLLSMDEPSVLLSNGEKHFFNRNELVKAAELIGKEYLDREVFPLVFISWKDAGEDVYLIKGDGADEIFRRLIGISKPLSRTPEGLAYTYKSLIIEFLKKYPSLGTISM